MIFLASFPFSSLKRPLRSKTLSPFERKTTFSTTRMTDSREVLLKLLARNREEFHIQWKGASKFSNHLSHGLIALYELGASGDRLKQFFDRYSAKLEKRIPPSPDVKVTESNWKTFIGKKEHYSELVQFSTDEVKSRGRSDALNKYVPYLVAGLGGGAFHGLITLGYALEIMDDNNIAEGLAYWTFVFKSFGTPSRKQPDGTRYELPPIHPAELLNRLQHEKIFDSLERSGFGDTMNKLASPEYSEVLGRYDIPIDEANVNLDKTVNFFMRVAIELFYFTGARDFFLLHGVTAMRAL